MKAVSCKVNHFVPIDDKGTVAGTYYLDQFGNLVEFSSKAKPKQVYLPYAVSVDLEKTDDVCTLHVSEVENVIKLFRDHRNSVNDPIKQAKYDGYIEALNYIVSHNSYVDPWNDFIHDIEEEFNYDRFTDLDS